MKITGLSVRDLASGREITVTALVAANEELDGSEVAQMLDIIKESGGADAAERPTDAPAQGRTRRRSPASSDAGQDAETGDASAADAHPQGRRRRSSTATEAPAEAPLGRRRRGSDTAATSAEPSAASPADASPAPTEGRRRRTGAAQAQTEEISDADLAKACSEAGNVITPKLVMDILQEDFGVDKVNKLTGDQRRKFLNTLNEEVKAELAASEE